MKPTRLLFLFIIGVLFLVAILISSFFVVYEKTTEKQLMTYGQMVLDGSVLYVDSMMESAKDLLDNLSLDSDVSMLLNYNQLSASSLLTGLRRLYKYEALGYFVDSIYIYNRRNNTVYVSSPHITEAVYDCSSFPDFDAAAILQDYSALKNMEPLFRTYNTTHPNISSIPYISFVRYNALAKENESNVIMVNLRQDILTNLITGENETNGSLLFIADKNGSIMLVAGNADIATEELKKSLSERLEKGKHNYSCKVQGNKYIVCSADVLGGHAKLLLVADEGEIASITRTKGYGNSIVFLGLVFTAILFLCIFFLKRLWLYYTTQMENLKHSEEEKRKLLEANKRNQILSYLHSDAIIDDSFLFNEYNGPFFLIILALDYYETSFTHRFEKTSERNEIKSNILKHFSQCCDEQNILISVYEDDEKCLLLTKEEIPTTALEETKNSIEEIYNISLTVIHSYSVAKEDIQDAYAQLCQNLSYRMFVGPGQIMSLDQLENQELVLYSIPKQAIKHLTEEILCINTTGTLLQLKEIIDEMTTCSYRSAQLSLLELAVALEEAFNRLQINNGIETAESESLIYKILRVEFIQDIYQIVENMMERIEKALLCNKNNRQTELINAIIRITKERFKEQDFSINTIADELEMNASYLGRIFKKTTGKTFSEFVLNERMEEASRLLASTDEPIDSIVSLVGFNDTPYFYKLFKRYSGSTPVRYRQENRTTTN